MEPRSAASRENRAARVAEWMLLTMEGESETPPILKARFQGNPEAPLGWEAMSAVRRRNHLLGIFHLQSAGARERRVDVAVEDAVRVARRGR
jgi:hypothetical protein